MGSTTSTPAHDVIDCGTALAIMARLDKVAYFQHKRKAIMRVFDNMSAELLLLPDQAGGGGAQAARARG